MEKPLLPRQTLSYLRRRFEASGIRPKTDLGQNFLIDLNLLGVLVEVGKVDRQDVVLEVGTGTGALTSMLSERAGRVVSVEVDGDLHALAGETLAGVENVRLLHQDALKNKNKLHPELLAVLEEELAALPDARFKLVANLPYHIATPLITNLLTLDRPPDLMAITIQKELADRMIARPRSKDYGSLSLWVQSQCRVKIARTLPPSVFWPRPKVTSAIVRLQFDPALRAQIFDREFFHLFVRRLFLHRRKFLRAQVLSTLGRKASKEAVDRVLAELNLEPQQRAEELTLETILALAKACRPLVDKL